MADNQTTISGQELKKQFESEQTKMRDLTMSLLPDEAKEAVTMAKANGVQPYCTQVGDQFFIYRILSRAEYKSFLINQAQTTQTLINESENQTIGAIVANLKNEDSLVCKCVLWPQVDEITIKTYPAGYVETINKIIMNSSGFNVDAVPVKL